MTSPAAKTLSAMPTSQIIPLETTERDYQMAGAVAPHVTLTGIGLVSLSAVLRQPPPVVIDQMAKGDLPAQIQWRHEKDLSPSNLDLTVRIDFNVQFGKASPDADSSVEVTCGFVLSYTLDAPPPEDTRDELMNGFAKVSAVYNAWPYMRELVQNSMARMNVPPPVIPVFRAVRPSQRPKVDVPRAEPAAEGQQDMKTG